MRQELRFDPNELQEHFHNPVFTMAYGSWVFKQEWYSDKDRPMIDFVFWVENPYSWHKSNLFTNPWDYSGISKLLWVEFVIWLQKRWAWIYYNPYVEYAWNTIKYWIISKNDLIIDLKEWNNLYVAGRLHKPVMVLHSDPQIQNAIDENLNHALNTALLLLPENFDERMLFEMITSISYMWDSRMKYWENPKKVANIVTKNIEWFNLLYSQILSWKSYVTGLNWWLFQQDISSVRSEFLVDVLPQNLKKWIHINWALTREELSRQIKLRVSCIIRKSSISQTLKWIITAWIGKSCRYASEKVGKARKK